MRWERILPWIEKHGLDIFLVGFFVTVFLTIAGL
jgi:hypothetical protein